MPTFYRYEELTGRSLMVFYADDNPNLLVCEEQVSPGSAGQAAGPILDKVSLVVHLPEDLAARVEAAAAQRGVSAEQVVAQAVAAHLPAQHGDDDTDPLEAFIGSGDSGDPTLAARDIHQLRHELAERRDTQTS
jgi:hypothetical protein